MKKDIILGLAWIVSVIGAAIITAISHKMSRKEKRWLIWNKDL